MQIFKNRHFKRVGVLAVAVSICIVTFAHEPFKVVYKVVEQEIEVDMTKTRLSPGDRQIIILDKKSDLIKKVIKETKQAAATFETAADSDSDAINELQEMFSSKNVIFEKADSTSTDPIYIVRRIEVISAEMVK